ncbi:hypothetical protein ASD16_06550 [Cellulomonas sp. Root485]|nr:hypothetical protein ASD16_06550 [Cellulomonas sp. Root485]
MSLIEVVIAMVVLGAMSVAVIGVIMNTQSLGVANRARVAASNLAARDLDIVREQFTRSPASPMAVANAGTQVNPNPLPGQTAGQPMVMDGKAYTLTRTVAWNVTGSGASACDGGSLVLYPTLRVTITVTWADMGAVKPVVTNASLAPKKDDGVQGTASFVAVKVTDAAGAASPGRGVQVWSASETKNGVTDTSGCAVIQVSPGAAGATYDARVTDAGYVDLSATPTPTKSVGMVATGQLVNNVTFAYDRAGSVTLHLVDESGAPVPPSAVVGGQITLVASEFSGASGARTVPATASDITVTGLWPTLYGAHPGTTPPATGYTTTPLPAGGSVDIDVVVTP